MEPEKLFLIPSEVTKDTFEDVMQQAITLELATIPTYLSTYYSIMRAQDQDVLYTKLKGDLAAAPGNAGKNIDDLAQELKVEILVYANKTAALIMSVVIEEMLHLALACNVKQAIKSEPKLMEIGKILKFPTKLDGHQPEFPINAAKLSLEQLSTFLQIESPEAFEEEPNLLMGEQHIEKYDTIGQLYDKIIACVEKNFGTGYTYSSRPQLNPKFMSGHSTPYYSQNSVNTIYFDGQHKPHFTNNDNSGDLIGVVDAATAIAAMQEIQHQGEGNTRKHQTTLKFTGTPRMPVPAPVKDGKVVFQPGDYDSNGELSHFAKFMEAYTLGGEYQKKFAAIEGLKDFFSYFVQDQASNPKQEEYDASGDANLALCSKLGNAIFAYTLLMVETCYYIDEKSQYYVFLLGVHKAMIWLLSGVGNKMGVYTFTRDVHQFAASLTFEYYDFNRNPNLTPKEQIITMTQQLGKADKKWAWLLNPEYDNYWPSLPDVRMDHKVIPQAAPVHA